VVLLSCHPAISRFPAPHAACEKHKRPKHTTLAEVTAGRREIGQIAGQSGGGNAKLWQLHLQLSQPLLAGGLLRASRTSVRGPVTPVTSYQFPFPVASVKVNSKLLLAKLLWRLVAGLPFWPTLYAEFIVCGVGQLQLQLLYCLYLGLINCNCRRLFHNFCIFIKLFFQQSCVKTFDCRCGRQPHRSIAAQLYLLSTQFST